MLVAVKVSGYAAAVLFVVDAELARFEYWLDQLAPEVADAAVTKQCPCLAEFEHAAELEAGVAGLTVVLVTSKTEVEQVSEMIFQITS